MADYHTTYKGLEGETTQWEDIHRRLGNLPPKEPKWKPDAFMPDAGPATKDSDWIQEQDAEALSDAEDEFQDDAELEELRQRRLHELQTASTKPRFGSIEDIRGSEFIQKVTNAGEDVWVVVLLHKDGHAGCKLLNACLEELAGKHPGTKFVRIVSTDAIPHYPDSNLPTLLLYHAGRCEQHLRGLATYGGATRIRPEAVALALNAFGPVCLAPGDEGYDEDGAEASTRGHVRALVRRLVAEKAGEADAGGGAVRRGGVTRDAGDESSDFDD